VDEKHIGYMEWHRNGGYHIFSGRGTAEPVQEGNRQSN